MKKGGEKEMKGRYEEVCKYVDILTKKDTRKLSYKDYEQATYEIKKKFYNK